MVRVFIVIGMTLRAVGRWERHTLGEGWERGKRASAKGPSICDNVRAVH